MVERIHCCRSIRREGRFADSREIICGKHWRLIPTAVRERHRQIKRRDRRLERLCRRKGFKEGRLEQWRRIGDLFERQALKDWERCKSEASILAAFGVDGTGHERRRAS